METLWVKFKYEQYFHLKMEQYLPEVDCYFDGNIIAMSPVPPYYYFLQLSNSLGDI